MLRATSTNLRAHFLLTLLMCLSLLIFIEAARDKENRAVAATHGHKSSLLPLANSPKIRKFYSLMMLMMMMINIIVPIIMQVIKLNIFFFCLAIKKILSVAANGHKIIISPSARHYFLINSGRQRLLQNSSSQKLLHHPQPHICIISSRNIAKNSGQRSSLDMGHTLQMCLVADR